MLFNTGYKASRCPQYENGDNIKYPTTDPIGGLKLYTEDYVQNIGNAIQEVLESTNTYTISEMASVISNMRPPEVADISIVYDSTTLGAETYTISDDGYYLIVVSGAGNNGNATDFTLPTSAMIYFEQKFMYSNANWYGAVKVAFASLTASDVISMNNGVATYSETQRKSIFRLTDIPYMTNLISYSIKTEINNDIVDDLTLPESGNVFIIGGCNGRNTRYDYTTGTECGYSTLTGGIGGRNIPVAGFLRIGYFNVNNLPKLNVAGGDGGLSWLLALQ